MPWAMKEVFSPPNQQIKHLCFLDWQCSSYLRKHVLSYYTENGIHCFGLLGIDICTSVPCIVCLKKLPGRPAANKTDKAWKRTLLPLYKPSKNWWHKNITRAIRHFLGISDECVKCLSSIHLSKYRSLIKFTMYKTQISYSFVNI